MTRRGQNRFPTFSEIYVAALKALRDQIAAR
jgi:hypothetical protein